LWLRNVCRDKDLRRLSPPDVPCGLRCNLRASKPRTADDLSLRTPSFLSSFFPSYRPMKGSAQGRRWLRFRRSSPSPPSVLRRLPPRLRRFLLLLFLYLVPLRPRQLRLRSHRPCRKRRLCLRLRLRLCLSRLCLPLWSRRCHLRLRRHLG
jgi:hypothetical protein